MDYYKYSVKTDPPHTEILIAFFGELPFDMFEENELGFDAFIPAHLMTAAEEAQLAELQERFPFSFEEEFVPGQNWNEIWETNFHPVVVDDFCGIRADFHEPLQNVEHELVINPKMAFGTGHHETTWMVLSHLRNINFEGKRVFDYGCGTGVLAILADRLGAAHVDAIDIEVESFENTKDNARQNKAPHVQAFQSDLEDFLEKNAPAQYDVILANINRNVILDSLRSLSGLVAPSGLLVISGFMTVDGEMMKAAVGRAGFRVSDTKNKGNWLAMLCEKE